MGLAIKNTMWHTIKIVTVAVFIASIGEAQEISGPSRLKLADWQALEQQLQAEMKTMYLELGPQPQAKPVQGCRDLQLHNSHRYRNWAGRFYTKRTLLKFSYVKPFIGYLRAFSHKSLTGQEPLIKVLAEARAVISSKNPGGNSFADAMRALLPHLNSDLANAARFWVQLYEGVSWISDPNVGEMNGRGRMAEFGWSDDYLDTFFFGRTLLTDVFRNFSLPTVQRFLNHVAAYEKDLQAINASAQWGFEQNSRKLSDLSTPIQCQNEIAYLNTWAGGQRATLEHSQSALTHLSKVLASAVQDPDSWNAFQAFIGQNLLLSRSSGSKEFAVALKQLATSNSGSEGKLANEFSKVFESQSYSEAQGDGLPIVMLNVQKQLILDALNAKDDFEIVSLNLSAQMAVQGLKERVAGFPPSSLPSASPVAPTVPRGTRGR